MTRAQLRSYVRRRLGRIPGEDVGLEVGTPNPAQPLPTNAELDAAIDSALADIGRSIPTRREELVVQWAPTTQEGPAVIPLQWTGIMDVSEVVVSTAGGSSRLEPTTRERITRDSPGWHETPAGTPTNFWIEPGYLYIWPNPINATTIRAYGGISMELDAADDAELLWIPANHHRTIGDLAAAMIAAAHPGDAEMAARVQLLYAESEAGKARLLEWLASTKAISRHGIQVHSYRR